MTVIVRVAPPKSSVEEISLTVCGFMLEAVMEPTVSVPPETSDDVEPPSLLNTRPASVLAPTSASREGPLRVTVFVGSIWPALVTSVRPALLSVTPPAGITTVPTPPPNWTWPPLNTVPPV